MAGRKIAKRKYQGDPKPPLRKDHKKLFHLAMIAVIGASFYYEAHWLADWTCLALSIAVEFS